MSWPYELCPNIVNRLQAKKRGNGPNPWDRFEHEDIKPPSYSRQPGRPKKLRRKEDEEKIDKGGKKWLGKQGLAMRCSHCGEEGHNSRTHHRHLPSNQKKKIGKVSGSKGKTKRKAARGKKKIGEPPNESKPSIEPIVVRTRSSKSSHI
ncbi:uncharacterized protein Pyn_27367 [Prunus yedoensis var. nudiflora]|uniref:CCHC-type domain-containing protein n=1 Tax=Prunus yedoensis var. nudiflora TaxID=2094558 RepID=A0A314YSC3_PRUYE|nr:uncharacterized protein Pyn_27367 [Prunus yedoensis var. nudiflora]